MANSHNGRSARAEVTASMAISAQAKRRLTPGRQAVLSHQLLAHVAAADCRGQLLPHSSDLLPMNLSTVFSKIHSNAFCAARGKRTPPRIKMTRMPWIIRTVDAFGGVNRP